MFPFLVGMEKELETFIYSFFFASFAYSFGESTGNLHSILLQMIADKRPTFQNYAEVEKKKLTFK